MTAEFDANNEEGFQFSAELPTMYKGKYLRGSKIITATNVNGIFIIQEVKQPEFSIRYLIAEFLKSTNVWMEHQDNPLTSLLAFRNNIRCFIKGLGVQLLKEGQFALIHPGKKGILMQFSEGKSQQYVEISWSMNLVKQAAELFPILHSSMQKFGNENVFALQKTGKYANHQSLGLIHDLLNVPFNEEIAKLYYEHKVREYLILLLVESGKIASSEIMLTKEEWEKLENLAVTMRNSTAKKFPIANLAIRTGMNEVKLKVAFKQRYGMGIFEYQLAARMQEAHRLVEENELSTKEIAAVVGYRMTTSFIKKFRAYFGYTPGSISKKNP
jgi:AraC-like DNA-binding protein